jgi:hypothetical protein
MYKALVARFRHRPPSLAPYDRQAPRVRANHRRLALFPLSITALLTSRSIVVAASATITGVAFHGTNAALTVIISGSGFGSAPSGIPCKSCTTPYINIGGRIGCFDSYNIVSWTGSQIVLSGLEANPYNQILISVTNPQNKTVGVLSTAISPSIQLSASPKIATVAFTGSGRNLHMTITGSGFGAVPPGVPGERNLPSLLFTDLPLETPQWNAGYVGCDKTSLVTLDYASWSDTKIVISGFGGAYGKGPSSAHFWQVTPGDVVSITVANSANDLKIGYSFNTDYPLFASPLGTGTVWSGQLP